MNKKSTVWLIILTAFFALALAACPTPDGGGGKTLVSIDVSLPAGFQYTPGSDLDLSGVTVTATYSDGSKETINTGKLKIEGYDKTKTGEQNITVSYGGKSVTVKITDSAGSGQPAPAANDFNVSGLSQITGSVTAVSIKPNPGKSTGVITVYYEGTGDRTYGKSTTPPTEAGTYAVTFDVAATTGFSAAVGLIAGTLEIKEQVANPETPTAADFSIGNLTQTAGNITPVTIGPKDGKSGGVITIYYEGTDATTYTKSTTLPTGAGTYAVTFDVGASYGFSAVTDLNAGTLTITAVSTPVYGITLSQTGDYTFAPAMTGYTVQTPLTLTVTNTGNQATGNLAVTLGGTNAGSFTLSKSSITGIAVSGTGAFTVAPKTGLAAGTYTATVTVSGGNGIAGQSFNLSFTVIDASTVYIITGSGTAFTAVKNGQTIGTASRPIQTVIDAIRTNANGSACVIMFGDGAATLNIGTASASFSGTGWGLITLTGKITGSITGNNNGVIVIADAVSVTSTADIENTSTTNGVNAIRNASTGTVTISGGTVSARGGGNGVWNASTGTVNISGGTVQQVGETGGVWVVCNYSTGTVNISGGTVSATAGVAVYNSSTGKITVSGTAKLTSANTEATESTIYLKDSGTATAVRLEITGGTVENTNTGNAIYNASTGAVNISGSVSADTGYSVYMNNASATLTLDGSPAITGRIRPSAAGKLTAASGFTPGGEYTLEYASYAPSAIAVVAGASYLSSFTLYDQTAWSLAASGNNIVIVSATAQPYSITLSESGTYTFTAATVGYSAAPTARTVTVTNSGNQATGALTAALSGTSASSFTLSKSSIDSIAVSGNDTFTVAPKTGLAVGTYTATVTVSGTNITLKTFNVSFTVNPASTTPTYSITLSESDTYTFTAATAGYAAQTPQAVTVTNTGNQATGNLAVTLGGPNSGSFTLSKTSITNIAVSGTDTFTVVPKTGLAIGTYTATVTVSGSNSISAAFNVSFTVNNAVINIAAIQGVTAPATGGTPVSAITENAQYSGTVTWSPAVASGRTVKIDMYDSGSDGWDGNGALRIVKNGTQLATGIKVQTTTANNTPSGQRNTNTYSFDVAADDTVQVYWVAGSYQEENSFIVYYADTPPSPAFTSSNNNSWSGTNALVYKLRGTMNNITNGTLLGSFTASGSGSGGTFAASTAYTATITLTAKTGYTLQGVAANYFTVAGAIANNDANSGVITAVFPQIVNPTYGITLSQTSAYTFTAAVVGYAAQTPLTITVTNNGNQETGALTAALSGTNASRFTLSTTSISSIAGNGTDSFTVAPNTGLAAGTYTATVTVSGGANITSKTFSVSFTVNNAVNIAAIQGVTAPVIGGTPVSAITENAQYSGTVSWSPALTSATKTVNIDMYDYNGDGWDGNGALRIVKNGTQLATGIKVQTNAANNNPSGQRNTNTYSFDVATGDAVQVYWVAGTSQSENSFIVYYADTPPSPAFSADNKGPTSWSGSNALVYRIRGNSPSGLNNVTNDTLLGSFTGSGVFAASTVYTATITLTAKTGYTLQGVAANYFTVAGATSVSNSANSGVITASFPAVFPAAVNIAAIQGVTAPVAWATPVSAITENNQYRGTVSWSTAASRTVNIDMYDYMEDGWDGNGALRIVKNGTQLATGIKVQTNAANNTPKDQRANNTYSFDVAWGDVVQVYWVAGTNQGQNSFIMYYADTPPSPAFSTTNYGPSSWSGDYALVYRVRGNSPSGLNNVTGGTLLGSFTASETFAMFTAYTATITLTAKTGYTLQGVASNFFTVAGATSVSNNANSGVVTAAFPATAALPDLPGTIIISPASPVGIGTELTAAYSGTETMRYQWKNGSTNVGTNSNKFTPTEAGNYTVTVSAAGYNSKTSDAITVNTWTAVSGNIIGGTNTSNIISIAYGNGTFVAGGNDGSSGGRMATSTNGTTWTAVSGVSSIFSTGTIGAIAYGNGTFVAGGSAGSGGKMATSTNSTTWTAVSNSTFGSSSINAIAYGNNIFVAVGNDGKMATSTNGTTWTAVSNSTFGSYYIQAIAYGNGKFVAGDGSGKMATSTNGTTWTAVSDSTFTSDILAIAYGNGKFFAGSYDGKMATSTNGTTWTTVSDSIFGSYDYIYAIAYGNNIFVAGSRYGKMVYLLGN
jgi:hypothetical protein